MLLVRYARRNLSRQRGRSLLTVLAVGLAVGLVIVGTTLIEGLVNNFLEEYARNTGHVRVRHPRYDQLSRFEPLEYTVTESAARERALAALPGAVAVLPRIRFGMMLQYTDTSTIVPNDAGVPESELTDEQIFGRKTLELASCTAIDPDKERARSKLESQLVRGRWFSAAADEIIVGIELAERLSIDVGKTLELISFRDGLRDTSARVVGVFDSGNRLINRGSIVPVAAARALLDLPDQATELLVFAPSLSESRQLLQELRSHPSTTELALAEWRSIGIMRTVTVLFRVVFGALTIAILVVAVAGLLNTMLMNVLERRREIGVLLALGLSRPRIIAAIVLEATTLAAIGAAVGALLGVSGSLYLVHHGIELGSGTENLPVAVGDVIYGRLTALNVVRAVALGGMTAVLGALWPAWKASKLNPVDAMRRR